MILLGNERNCHPSLLAQFFLLPPDAQEEKNIWIVLGSSQQVLMDRKLLLYHLRHGSRADSLMLPLWCLLKLAVNNSRRQRCLQSTLLAVGVGLADGTPEPGKPWERQPQVCLKDFALFSGPLFQLKSLLIGSIHNRLIAPHS